MRSILLPVFAFVMRLLCATWRFRERNAPSPMLLDQAIILFWHDEMLPVWHIMAPRRTQQPATALTSMSKDGDVLAYILAQWQYNVVRGSSSRGGSEALQEIIHAAEFGTVLLTPDGPRGPRHVCKAGGIVAAHRTRKPLILCRVQAHGWRLAKSWDRFLLPYPFAEIILTWSDAHRIPPETDGTDLALYIADIQDYMNTLLHSSVYTD